MNANCVQVVGPVFILDVLVSLIDFGLQLLDLSLQTLDLIANALLALFHLGKELSLFGWLDHAERIFQLHGGACRRRFGQLLEALVLQALALDKLSGLVQNLKQVGRLFVHFEVFV